MILLKSPCMSFEHRDKEGEKHGLFKSVKIFNTLFNTYIRKFVCSNLEDHV